MIIPDDHSTWHCIGLKISKYFDCVLNPNLDEKFPKQPKLTLQSTY